MLDTAVEFASTSDWMRNTRCAPVQVLRRIRLCLENGQVLEPPDRRYRACLEDMEPLGSGRNTGSLPKGVCFLIQPLNPLLPSLINNTMVIAIADSVNCKFSLALT